MAATGKKEYTIKINGIAQNVKDVTKLEDALLAAERAAKKLSETEVKGTQAVKGKTAALTDEEKAAKKLQDTQDRIAKANTASNRAQIQANIELRERTREITRQVAASQLAEGSIKSMGMSLTDLRNEYEELTAAQRADEAVGGALITQIQALDAEYKALRESTGNFRDSVGNYEKGFKGLNELKDKFELAARGSHNLAAETLGTNDVLDAFGATTDAVAKSSEGLAGVMALATVAEEAYVAITKEGIIQQKAAAIMDGIRAIQLKAKTAAEAMSTKGTVAATVAQGIFNLVAAANPYVLLALALIAVIGTLIAFTRSTDDAAESQTEINELQRVYLDLLEQEAGKLKATSDARVQAAETNLAILNASGAKIGEIRAAEDALFKERAAANASQRGFYARELEDLEKNRAKVEEFREVLRQLNMEKARGEDKIKLDIDLDGKIDKVKIDEAITAVQGSIDNYGRTVQIAVDIKAERAALDAEAKVLAAQRTKQDKDLAKDRADKAAQARATELSAVRAGEDVRIKLIGNAYEQARATVITANRREIEDLKIRLATEKDLTVKARKAINQNIAALEKLRGIELKALSDERTAKELETMRAYEDGLTGLIVGELERRRAEVNTQYGREIQDLQKRLDTETDLTARQQQAILNTIINKRKAQDKQLLELQAASLRAQADAELSALDTLLDNALTKIGDATARSKTGFRLIDVDATRANLAATNKALDEYIDRIQDYVKDLDVAHKAILSTLQEGTPEYEAEVLKYSAAVVQAAKRIKDAQAEQVANTKSSTDAQIDFYKEVGEKVTEYAQLASELTSGLVQTVNTGLQVQLDEMTGQLDVINEKYEAAQKQREDAAKNVEDIEAQIQGATGGTATALKQQLADAMAARNEAAREERRLAKEKEKLDADIAKKEKQMRRNDLLANIAGGIANTAQGVTKALGLIFPLNLFVAGLVGAMGAVQVGIMTKQLTKLAKGGKIEGRSHAEGGVDLAANYEVEGGEFMVNKHSYARNGALIEYINANPQGITASEIVGLLPDDTTPAAVNEISRTSDERILDAISEIEFRPVVAVTDIMNAQDSVVEVQDLAGYS